MDLASILRRFRSSPDPADAFLLGKHLRTKKFWENHPGIIASIRSSPYWSLQATIHWEDNRYFTSANLLSEAICQDPHVSIEAWSHIPPNRVRPGTLETLIAPIIADKDLAMKAIRCWPAPLSILASMAPDELDKLGKGYQFAERCRQQEFIQAFERDFRTADLTIWKRWACLQDIAFSPSFPEDHRAHLTSYLSMAPFEFITVAPIEELLAHTSVYRLFKAVETSKENHNRGTDRPADHPREDATGRIHPSSVLRAATERYRRFRLDPDQSIKNAWITAANRYETVDAADQKAFLDLLNLAPPGQIAALTDEQLKTATILGQFYTSIEKDHRRYGGVYPRRPSSGSSFRRNPAILRDYISSIQQGTSCAWVDVMGQFNQVDDGRKNEYRDLLARSSPEILLRIPRGSLPTVLDAFVHALNEKQEHLFASQLPICLQEGTLDLWATTIIHHFKEQSTGGGTYRELGSPVHPPVGRNQRPSPHATPYQDPRLLLRGYRSEQEAQGWA